MTQIKLKVKVPVKLQRRFTDIMKLSLHKAVKNPKALLILIHDFYLNSLLHTRGFKQIKSNLHHNSQTHTAYLDLEFYWMRKRKLWTDKKEKAFIRIKVDRGWDWMEVKYYNLEGEELKGFISCIVLRLKILEGIRELWTDYNPSSRTT